MELLETQIKKNKTTYNNSRKTEITRNKSNKTRTGSVC